MEIILKEDEGVKVLRMGSLVQKEVRGKNPSGINLFLPPNILVDREVRALELLVGIPGIQKLVGRSSSNTFLTEFLDGKPLSSITNNLGDSYFDKLWDLECLCFERGVYRIGQNRQDFLVLPDGNPGIIDFGNVFFEDDFMSKYLGLLRVTKTYSRIRINDLKHRYAIR